MTIAAVSEIELLSELADPVAEKKLSYKKITMLWLRVCGKGITREIHYTISVIGFEGEDQALFKKIKKLAKVEKHLLEWNGWHIPPAALLRGRQSRPIEDRDMRVLSTKKGNPARTMATTC